MYISLDACRSLRRIAGHTLDGLLAFGGCIPTIMGIMPVAKMDIMLLGKTHGGLCASFFALHTHLHQMCSGWRLHSNNRGFYARCQDGHLAARKLFT